MQKGVNKVILIGNMGQDPEVKYMPNGDAVVNFSLATSESWKDKQSGEQKELTEWHKVVFYGKTAETINQYCRKGSKLFVEGKLKTKKWQDNNGNDRYTTEINGFAFQFLDPKGSQGQSTGKADGQLPPVDYTRSPLAEKPATEPQAQPQAQSQQGANDVFDDDIPF